MILLGVDTGIPNGSWALKLTSLDMRIRTPKYSLFNILLDQNIDIGGTNACKSSAPSLI